VVALSRERDDDGNTGTFERADFLRLREASATYELPAAVARAVRADRLSFYARRPQPVEDDEVRPGSIPRPTTSAAQRGIVKQLPDAAAAHVLDVSA